MAGGERATTPLEICRENARRLGDQLHDTEAEVERLREALRVIAEGESPREHQDVAAEALAGAGG
jgi:hypothetical protein